MVKYSEIIESFRVFCNKHKQINTFYSGQEWDFQKETNIYPAVVILPQPSTINQGQVVLAFNIFVADIMHKELILTTDDIYSDTLLILQDLISYFEDNDDLEFKLDGENINIEPFEEKIDDVLCGWVANVSIKFRFGWSDCNLPMED